MTLYAIVTGEKPSMHQNLKANGFALSSRNKSKKPRWMQEVPTAMTLWPVEGILSAFLYNKSNLRDKGVSLRFETY